jgi:putative DNA primase/helicase
MNEAINMGAHARAYLRKGWQLVPLWWIREPGVCACPDGEDCRSAGKHPLTNHGVNEALAKGIDVDLWWQRHPSANIGIATGEKSGIVVVDVDKGKGGFRSLKQIRKTYGRPPDTPISITGSNGRHILFLHPGERVKNAVGYMPGIDVRGDGGLIVAPPSMHVSGNRYRWHPEAHPAAVKLAPMPVWMETFCELDKKKRQAKKGMWTGGKSQWGKSFDPDKVPNIGQGERNDTLCSITGRLIWENRELHEIMEIILGLNDNRCSPPLDDKEVRRLVDLAYKRWA